MSKKIFRLHKNTIQTDGWFNSNNTVWVDNNDQNIQRENYSDSDIIWRYMDLSKFLSILEYRQLYLTRIDKFEDKFEGSFPIEDFKINAKKLIGSAGESLLSESKETFVEALKLAYKYGVFVNCWHQNNFESYAMWKVYLKSNEGIAIKTTVGNLKKSILNNNSDWVSYYKVEYLDYDKDSILSTVEKKRKAGYLIPPLPVFFKRKDFEYEKEFRIMTMYEASVSDVKDLNVVNAEMNIMRQTAKECVKINIDLNELIQELYISPFADSWYYELIKNLLTRYALDKPIYQSKINNKPEYE